MTNKKLSLILCAVAAILCIGLFIYQWISKEEIDAMILFAGLCIMALGFGIYYRK